MKSKLLFALSVSLLLTILVVTVVSAAVNWVPSSFVGPTWLNPGYEFTFDVTGFTGGTSDICLVYSVNGSPYQESHCTCTSPECVANVGTWRCVIPSNEPNAAIVWDISGWTGGSCNGSPSLIQDGTFNTGPNAIELSSFDVINGQDNKTTFVPIIIFSVFVLSLAMGLFWKYKTDISQE
jgi:hypothetical protein